MKLKREKACQWSAYIRSHDPIDFARYCSCRNKLRALTRKLRSEFEQKISVELKSNPKVFWRYTNSRMKTKAGIEDLQDENGQMCSDDLSKANTLNRFFSSVFTKEDTTAIPALPASAECTPLEDIAITEETVMKALDSLKTTSSPGPDEIHSGFLRRLLVRLQNLLPFYFRNLWTQAPYLKIGN